MPAASGDCMLQRSHAPGCVERVQLLRLIQHLVTASTEPRTGVRGEGQGMAFLSRQTIASTEPRTGVRGEPENLCARCKVGVLQRSHAPGCVERKVNADYSAAAGSLQRSHAPGCVERLWLDYIWPKYICFNGATHRGAWRVPKNSSTCLSNRNSFNGATHRGAWRGNGLPRDFLPKTASTEPRTGVRGETKTATMALTVQAASTEPRTGVRGEVRASFFLAPVYPSFNGATHRGAWRGPHAKHHRTGNAGFNGATHRGAWRGRPMRLLRSKPSCFNGATHRGAWRGVGRRFIGHGRVELQRSHAPGCVERAASVCFFAFDG